MAEKSDDADKNGRRDWQTLLLGLKRTVEGLLATHSNNVWSTYGGLSRLCVAVENILVHRLKVYHYRSDLGCVPDYWPFIQGLKWLQPTSAPTIDRLNRTAQTTDQLGKGPVWLRESLQTHTLSSQLKILVMNYAHISQFYHDDAFLCNGDYFQAMYLCLQAVELNKVSVLTEIDLSLITRYKKVSHVRSASLPINQFVSDVEMGRRKSSSHDVKALAPPFMSPKSESILGPSVERVLPYNIESAPEDSTLTSAKDALISVLEKSGGSSSSLSNSPLLDTSFSLVDRVNNDPLMNVEISSSSDNLRKLAARKSKPRNMSASSYHTAEIRNANSVNLRKSASTSEYVDDTLSRSPDSGLTATSPDNLLDDILNYEDDNFDQEITNSLHSTSSKNVSNDFNAPMGSHSSEKMLKKRSTNIKQKRKTKVLHRRVKSDVINQRQPLHRPLSMIDRNNSCMDNPSDQSDSTLVEHSNRSASLPKIKSTYLRDQSWDETDNRGLVENTDGYFPKPAQGQSLRSYLSSQDFHTCANIDKENAHFSISEALIAAIEQMKWNHVLTPRSASDHEDGDSDEEIQELKQRIRIRRRERLTEKAKGYQLLSDGRTETTTTSSCSPSSPHGSYNGSDDSGSSDEEVDDGEIELTLGDAQSSNLTALKDSGLSLSMASLYSDADIVRTNTAERQSSVLEVTGSYVSAESVAISLLKKFSEKQLPKASDLEWLVSEQDAPQALLPLPDSYPISPDDGENADLFRTTKRPRIRGNLEWAPPRPQIIFNIHPSRKRNVILSKQNDRCAGCGMKVEPGYGKRFRYCEYLGKYFCQCCHTNSLCYIPGRILQKWDFTRYSVSHFSRDLLTKLFDTPLYNLEDVNPGLYRKVGVLSAVRDLRTQLFHLLNVLRICKAANSLYADLQKLPSHWMDESQLYSVADLLRVKSGEMQQVLKELFVRCTSHVTSCQFCHGMGFICEFCSNAQDVIFPYQLHKVTRCSGCKACYHKSCFVPEKCPKCARLEARRQRLLMDTPSPEHERSHTTDDSIVQLTDDENS